MRHTLHRAKHTGVNERASRPLSLIQTAQIEEEDRKAQTEIEKWAWEVHEVALHNASQREGLPAFGSIELLLRKISEEITRQAQEKLRRDRRKVMRTSP
jgi:hypothetical protein